MLWELDAELVYRKRIRRDLDEYRHNVPPHIQAARKLGGTLFREHTLEFQGRIRDMQKLDNDWWDMFLTVSYRPSKYFSGGLTYEYTKEHADRIDDPAANPRRHFGGVTLTANFTGTSYLRFYGGSTRGGLRCVDGFCRVFPPFIGAKGELVLQF